VLRIERLLELTTPKPATLLERVDNRGMKAAPVVRPWFSQRILGRLQVNSDAPGVKAQLSRRPLGSPLIATTVLHPLQRNASRKARLKRGNQMLDHEPVRPHTPNGLGGVIRIDQRHCERHHFERTLLPDRLGVDEGAGIAKDAYHFLQTFRSWRQRHRHFMLFQHLFAGVLEEVGQLPTADIFPECGSQTCAARSRTPPANGRRAGRCRCREPTRNAVSETRTARTLHWRTPCPRPAGSTRAVTKLVIRRRGDARLDGVARKPRQHIPAVPSPHPHPGMPSASSAVGVQGGVGA